jgi:pyruvate dehydrogenase E2 component (dihydrolipoamide acetyltransferase)
MSQIAAVTMPKWGIEMVEGTINGWTVEVGQAIARGDALLDVETEKIVNTVEAPAAGVLRRQIGAVGDVYPVGVLIGVIADASIPEAQIDAFIATFKGATVNFEPDAPDAAATATTAPAAAPASGGDAAADGGDGEQRVSPIARRVAEKLCVDLSQVRGTGRNGRISKEDVEAFAAAQSAAPTTSAAAPAAPAAASTPAAAGQTRRRMSATRATIARRLLESYQNLPHFRLACDVDASRLILKKGEVSDHTSTRITVNDMLVRACSIALLRHPLVNSQLQGDEIVQFAHADIAVAVATENGLITPIVRQADTLNVAQIARATADLSERALRGALTREEISGGTFTISNLGMHGIARFDAIINPPQVAILAVGAAEERVVARNGVAVVARMMTLTLSVDHRVIDGAVGAAFLQTLRQLIEQPDSL